MRLLLQSAERLLDFVSWNLTGCKAPGRSRKGIDSARTSPRRRTYHLCWFWPIAVCFWLLAKTETALLFLPIAVFWLLLPVAGRFKMGPVTVFVIDVPKRPVVEARFCRPIAVVVLLLPVSPRLLCCVSVMS